MVAGVIAVECLVLVKQISLGHETAVNVAVFEIDHGLAFVVDVGDRFSSAFAESALEDEEVAMAENYAAALEGRVAPWFAVEDTGKLGDKCQQLWSNVWSNAYPDSTAERNIADIVQLRRSF